MLRVTDALTRPDRLNRSYFGPSSAEQNTWNADSTIMYALGGGGEAIPYAFNPATMTASRMGNLGNGSGGLVLLMGEPSFSFTNPDALYGIAGANGRTLVCYSFLLDANTPILNLDDAIPGLSGYTGSISVSADGRLNTYCGGAAQDLHRYAVVRDQGTSTTYILDTQAGTIDGVPNTDITWGWLIHNTRIDKSGRYVVMTAATGPYGLVVWDVLTGQVTHITPNASGHKVSGYGTLINQDYKAGSPYDAMQWVTRSLLRADIGAVTELITPLLTPTGQGGDSHPSWNQAQPGVNVPMVLATYRLDTDVSAWRAWDDEIIAVRTDGVVSTVWRFAHHRSKVTAGDFYEQPRGNVSQDGRWFLFSSNWEETVGSDGPTLRVDAFIVKLG
jgi:hypothetical protein